MGRSPYDFEAMAAKDFKRYIKSFELPPPHQCDPLEILLLFERPSPVLEAEVHRDRDGTVDHHEWRSLELIRQIQRDNFDGERISSWVAKSIPLSIDHATLFAVRTHARYHLPDKLSDKFYSHKPSNLTEMQSWILLVTRTITRVMHVSFPETRNWDFTAGRNPRHERAWFRYVLWQTVSGVKRPPSTGKVLFAYQTPFCLNEQDMQEFVQCKAFLSAPNVPATSLQGKFRLWANLWDACAEKKVQYFVLTSYSQWVFGHFAGNMSAAFVSPVYRYDTKSPNVLELIIFWLASAIKMTNTYRPAPVETPINNDMEIEVHRHPEPIVDPRREIPRRETFWEGKFDEPGSSAGVRLGSMPLSREGSVCSVYPEPEQVEMKRPEIQEWLGRFENAVHRRLDEDDFYGPPPIDAVEDTFNPNISRGKWMAQL